MFDAVDMLSIGPILNWARVNAYWLWSAGYVVVAVLLLWFASVIAVNWTTRFDPRLLVWRFKNRMFWFQQRRPIKEFESFIVEGKPGEGKTRFLAVRAVQAMRSGYRVYSNFTVRDRVTGQQTLPLGDWLEMFRASVDALENRRPTLFVIDEIHLWCGSRDFKVTPKWWLSLVAQHRHYHVGLLGSTQNLQRVEIVVRELVDQLVRIRNRTFLRIPLFMMERVDPATVDSDTGYALSKAVPYWMPWFGGYDTQELMSVERWQSDKAMEAEIKELTQRARAAADPGLIPAFSDERSARVGNSGDFSTPTKVEESRVGVIHNLGADE